MRFWLSLCVLLLTACESDEPPAPAEEGTVAEAPAERVHPTVQCEQGRSRWIAVLLVPDGNFIDHFAGHVTSR